MKKIRVFIVMLAAVLLFLPGMNVKAATKQLDAGTRKATVTMTLKDLLSLEGEFEYTASEGAKLTVSSVEASTDGFALCSMVDDRIFMVSSGEAVTVTITMELVFSADGTYTITLDGGRTDAAGKYEDYSGDKDKEVDKLIINVGTPSSGSSGSNKNDKHNSSGSNSSSNNSSTQNSGTDTSGEVDYSALEQAISDANAAISSNKELQSMQNLLDKTNEGTVLLNSDDQSKIDDAALEIQKGLEDLGEEIVVDKDGTDAMAGFGSIMKNIWKFLLALLLILLMVAAILIGIWLWNKVGKDGPDYDGAPDVDYDINEDDE